MELPDPIPSYSSKLMLISTTAEVDAKEYLTNWIKVCNDTSVDQTNIVSTDKQGVYTA
jgi:hypothetical protein